MLSSGMENGMEASYVRLEGTLHHRRRAESLMRAARR